MSIYFRNTPVSAPFMFESLGNHWNQVNIFRPDGYPYYHYLQTEKGTGRIEVRGKFYTLGANEGILIAPGVPHSYHRESTSWTTMFATFTGTLAGSIPSMTDNQEVILIEKEQGASIRKMISSTLRKYHQPTPDMKSLSSDCYNFLMNFTDCAASPKIQDNPLYQRYVIPVIKEIETGYQQDITAAQLSRSVFVLDVLGISFSSQFFSIEIEPFPGKVPAVPGGKIQSDGFEHLPGQHTDVKLHLEMGGEHPAHLGLDFVQGLIAAAGRNPLPVPLPDRQPAGNAGCPPG